MLISNIIKTKWNSKTVKYYKEKGYTYNKGDIGKEFEVKVSDLKRYSEQLINVKCDYNEDGCEQEILKRYCEYIDSHEIIDKDCCNNPKCKQKKLEESLNLKYGVSNISNSEYFKEKYKDIMQEKYGVGNYFSLSSFTKENNYGFKDTNIICNNCGKKIHRKESQIHDGLNFCSIDCKTKYKRKISKLPEHLQVRNSTEYRIWRNKVIDRDKRTCQCCGKIGGELQVHHIENFLNNIELRLDINNGKTFCKDCHSIERYGSFHNIYGTKNNSKEQLEEYIQRFKNGEFDELRKLNKEYKISETKICPQCKNKFPNTNEYFVKDKYSKDGLSCTCKLCRRKYYKKKERKQKEVS